MAGSEAFALIIMGGASYALIRFIGWGLSNTLDYRAGKLANRDRLSTAFGDVPVVPQELRLPSKKVGGVRPRKAGEPVFNANGTQQNELNSHLNSRSKFTGQGGL